MASPQAKQQEGRQHDDWLITKENFVQNASREDQRLFRRSPADIQKEIAEIQKKQTGPVGDCLKRIQPFFDGIQKLDFLISGLADLVPYGIGSLVWGSLKLCMDLVSKYTKIFEDIEDFLCKTGAQLERLEVLEKLYKSSPAAASRFNTALNKVFTRYLAFFQYTKDYLESSHTRKLRESVGLTKHSKLALVTLSMDLVNESCNDATEEAKIAESQARATADKDQSDALSNIEEKFDKFYADSQSNKAESVFQDYLDWLKHIDMEDKVQSLLAPTKNSQTEETGVWIFEDGVFRDWAMSSKDARNLLWLTGDPGFGKSTLSASVVTELRQWQPTGYAYFFCQHQNTNTRTIASILRTWIWQLLHRPRVGRKVFQGHCKMPESEWDFTRSEDPSCEIMMDVMRQLFEQRRPTRLIVDGLDECYEPFEDSADEADWLDFFQLLKDAPPEWKILVVSRPRTWYRKKFIDILGDKLTEREITSADNSAEIHSFIDYKLGQIATKNAWSAKVTEAANKVLLSNSKGMFLWVSLFCIELRYKNGKQEDKIWEALKNPPSGLFGFYRRNMEALGNLHPDLAEDLRTALKWMLCAPRALKIDELEFALNMTPEVREDFVQTLGSFIKINTENQDIIFFHASAREYLLLPEAGLINDGDPSDQAKLIPFHAKIFERCIEHICVDGRKFISVGRNQGEAEPRFRNALRDDPFLEYSHIYWVQHLTEAAKPYKNLTNIKPALDKFLCNDLLILRWLQLFHFLYQFNYPGSSISKNRIGDLVYQLPKPDTWENFIHTNYKSLIEHLSWGDGKRFTRWDRFMHIRHEFNAHAEPQRWFQSPTCFPKISIAAFFNFLEIVKDMIKEGLNIEEKGPLAGTALIWAATADSCAVLEFLLDSGADKEAQFTNTSETAIYRTIRFPHAIARKPGSYPASLLLFKRGANLNISRDIENWIDRTVLITLIEEGMDSPGACQLIKAILKHDESRRRDYVRRGNVLQTAAWFGRPLMLEELLQDDYVRSRIDHQVRATAALHDACTSNSPETVQKLLDAGANVDLSSSLNGFTPLHFAVLFGGKCVATVLNAGANPNICALNADYAMHLGAAHNVDLDFQLFIDKGYKIDQLNAVGKSALAVALEHSNSKIVGKLLDLGADPEKIPEEVLRQASVHGLDERLVPLKKRVWQPCWTFELCWTLKKRVATFGKKLPIYLISRIIREADVCEKLFAHRKGRSTVNESMTLHGGELYPYITSPPIFGCAARPVRNIILKVNGHCQSFGGQHSWSFYEVKTVKKGSQVCEKWKPERIFGHNGRKLEEKQRVFNIDNDEDRNFLKPFHEGDRVAIIQRAHFPGWENTTESASIEVDIRVLRNRYSAKEMDEIWQHNRDSRGKCKIGLCPRCATRKRPPKKYREVDDGNDE